MKRIVYSILFLNFIFLTHNIRGMEGTPLGKNSPKQRIAAIAKRQDMTSETGKRPPTPTLARKQPKRRPSVTEKKL